MQMQPSRKTAAIDLGGTAIKSALIDSNGDILKSDSRPTEVEVGRERVIGNIIAAVRDIADAETSTVGIGSPGCVDPLSGRVDWAENLACINGISLTAEVEKALGFSAFIDNDANNAVRAEYLFGRGADAKFLLGVTLGTGVGGGLIFEGKMHRGIINYAGEIGHITYQPSGLRCSCGMRGCLETYASASAVIREARSLQRRGLMHALADQDPDSIDAEMICNMARSGDEIAQQLIEEAGRALGTVLGSVINLLGVDQVVIGGGMSAAGEILLGPIRRYAQRHTLPLAMESCRIEAGQLGNQAGVLGSAALVFMEG